MGYDACKERSENARLRIQIERLIKEFTELQRSKDEVDLKLRNMAELYEATLAKGKVLDQSGTGKDHLLHKDGNRSRNLARSKTAPPHVDNERWRTPPRPPLPEAPESLTPRGKPKNLGELAASDAKWQKLLDDPGGLFTPAE